MKAGRGLSNATENLLHMSCRLDNLIFLLVGEKPQVCLCR